MQVEGQERRSGWVGREREREREGERRVEEFDIFFGGLTANAKHKNKHTGRVTPAYNFFVAFHSAEERGKREGGGGRSSGLSMTTQKKEKCNNMGGGKGMLRGRGVGGGGGDSVKMKGTRLD